MYACGDHFFRADVTFARMSTQKPGGTRRQQQCMYEHAVCEETRAECASMQTTGSGDIHRDSMRQHKVGSESEIFTVTPRTRSEVAGRV